MGAYQHRQKGSNDMRYVGVWQSWQLDVLVDFKGTLANVHNMYHSISFICNLKKYAQQLVWSYVLDRVNTFCTDEVQCTASCIPYELVYTNLSGNHGWTLKMVPILEDRRVLSTSGAVIIRSRYTNDLTNDFCFLPAFIPKCFPSCNFPLPPFIEVYHTVKPIRRSACLRASHRIS